jgi:hypothetical protein
VVVHLGLGLAVGLQRDGLVELEHGAPVEGREPLAGELEGHGHHGALRLAVDLAPRLLIEMLRDPDPGKSSRVMQAKLVMKKIDIATLERAYAGSSGQTGSPDA